MKQGQKIRYISRTGYQGIILSIQDGLVTISRGCEGWLGFGVHTVTVDQVQEGILKVGEFVSYFVASVIQATVDKDYGPTLAVTQDSHPEIHALVFRYQLLQ
jgi:hypothetical protein